MAHTTRRCFEVADLPEDIARIVFEITAEIPSGAEKCALVSRRVKQWVEPILYRDVIVDGKDCFHRTVTALESTKPPGFFANQVKSLLFEGTALSNTLKAAEILEKCCSVRSLALWDPLRRYRPELQALFTSTLLAPTRLSISSNFFGEAGGTFSHSIFRNVTHLRIPCDAPYEGEWDIDSLGTLQRLTHLVMVMPMYTFTAIMATTLSHCPPSLRVLVILADDEISLTQEEEVLAINRGEVDPRLIIQSNDPAHQSVSLEGWEVWDEWGHPSTCKTTLWSKAEEFIRNRQSYIYAPVA